jgi:hypothetical protein
MIQSLAIIRIPECNISRRNHNRLCHEKDRLLPIINEQTGLIPGNFPLSKADLSVIPTLLLEDLLSFYNLPRFGTLKDEHLAFCEFIGVD